MSFFGFGGVSRDLFQDSSTHVVDTHRADGNPLYSDIVRRIGQGNGCKTVEENYSMVMEVMGGKAHVQGSRVGGDMHESARARLFMEAKKGFFVDVGMCNDGLATWTIGEYVRSKPTYVMDDVSKSNHVDDTALVVATACRLFRHPKGWLLDDMCGSTWNYGSDPDVIELGATLGQGSPTIAAVTGLDVGGLTSREKELISEVLGGLETLLYPPALDVGSTPIGSIQRIGTMILAMRGLKAGGVKGKLALLCEKGVKIIEADLLNVSISCDQWPEHRRFLITPLVSALGCDLGLGSLRGFSGPLKLLCDIDAFDMATGSGAYLWPAVTCYLRIVVLEADLVVKRDMLGNSRAICNMIDSVGLEEIDVLMETLSGILLPAALQLRSALSGGDILLGAVRLEDSSGASLSEDKLEEVSRIFREKNLVIRRSDDVLAGQISDIGVMAPDEARDERVMAILFKSQDINEANFEGYDHLAGGAIVVDKVNSRGFTSDGIKYGRGRALSKIPSEAIHVHRFLGKRTKFTSSSGKLYVSERTDLQDLKDAVGRLSSVELGALNVASVALGLTDGGKDAVVINKQDWYEVSASQARAILSGFIGWKAALWLYTRIRFGDIRVTDETANLCYFRGSAFLDIGVDGVSVSAYLNPRVLSRLPTYIGDDALWIDLSLDGKQLNRVINTKAMTLHTTTETYSGNLEELRECSVGRNYRLGHLPAKASLR